MLFPSPLSPPLPPPLLSLSLSLSVSLLLVYSSLLICHSFPDSFLFLFNSILPSCCHVFPSSPFQLVFSLCLSSVILLYLAFVFFISYTLSLHYLYILLYYPSHHPMFLSFISLPLYTPPPLYLSSSQHTIAFFHGTS